MEFLGATGEFGRGRRGDFGRCRRISTFLTCSASPTGGLFRTYSRISIRRLDSFSGLFMSIFPNCTHGGLKWGENATLIRGPASVPPRPDGRRISRIYYRTPPGAGYPAYWPGSSAETGTGDASFPGTIADIALFWRWAGKCVLVGISSDSKYAFHGGNIR